MWRYSPSEERGTGPAMPTPPEVVRFDPGRHFEELIRAEVDRW
ncbi:hypothetical protein AB0K15_12315 [Amycolatopsis sp. NPDC049253]